jgi:hypothetical protein
MGPPHMVMIYGSFPLFSDFQLFSGLSTTDETLVVEMRIWCIKIGNVFALHYIPSDIPLHKEEYVWFRGRYFNGIEIFSQFSIYGGWG